MHDNFPILAPTQLLEILTFSNEATVIFVSEDIHIGYINASMLNIWGKENNVISHRLIDVAPEFESFIPILQDVWVTGKTFKAKDTPANILVEGVLVKKYFNFEYRPILDKNGKTYAIINTATDVSERRQALLDKEISERHLNDELLAINEEQEAAIEELRAINEELSETRSNLNKANTQLIESEIRVREILEQAPLGMCMLIGPEHTIEIANESILKIWGRNKNEVIGKAHRLARPELTGQPVYEWLDEVYNTGKARKNHEFKVMLYDHGGLREAYVNSIYQPIRGAHGEVNGVLVILEEVTDDVKRRIKAQRTQDMLNLAIEAGGFGTFYYNPVSNRFTGNEILKIWFGLTKDNEISLKLATDVISESDRERVIKAIETALTYGNGGNYDIEYSIYAPGSESLRMVRAKGKAIFDSDNKPISLNGTLQDITELKQDEQRKNDFIGMVSHELKTPLTSLKAYLQLLQVKAVQDPFTVVALGKADIQVKKMTTMIDGFLNLSRLESGKIYLDLQRFDVEELIEEVKTEIAVTSTSNPVIFKRCNPIYVHADRNKIGQVITNLLSNAIKYSVDRQNIEISCSITEDKVTVSIKDYGIGIKPEDIERLFERFYRVDTSDMKTISGFGIGLYLSAEIIQRHNGKIWVESDFGTGSTFHFSLSL
jgi:two-component system sensor histidine kinase VicK